MIAYLKDFFQYRFVGDIKHYVLQKEDIYIPDYIVDDDPFQIDGLKISFPGITKKKLAENLTPTEDIFNKHTEIFPFSPENIEVNEQIEIENFIKKTQFIQELFFIQ